MLGAAAAASSSSVVECGGLNAAAVEAGFAGCVVDDSRLDLDLDVE